MTVAQDPSLAAGLRQLRHDLLNPMNVLVGATSALLRTDMDDAQLAWLRMLQSSTQRLQEIIDRIDSYQTAPALDGRQRLADLCSIAAARVSKPVDRERLVNTIRGLVGDRPARVLVVDDSPELTALIRLYLDGTGWTVDAVETGERAVEKAGTEQYDVLLMDIDLPGLDGATAAHAIRTADLARGVSPTPIVAMTAFDPGPAATDADADVPPSGPIVRIDDPEIAPLVPQFLENRRAELAMFREALQAGEYARIQSAAHKLKGTGRGYGLTEISRIGGELELAAHQQDTAAISRLLDALDAFLARVTIV